MLTKTFVQAPTWAEEPTFRLAPSSRECLADALPKWSANCIREGSSSWRFTKVTNERKCQIDCPSCTALPLWDAYVQRNRSPVPTSHLLDAECPTWQTFFNLSRKPPGFHPSSCRTDPLRIANEITAYTGVPVQVRRCLVCGYGTRQRNKRLRQRSVCTFP
jgi:hypothetical protein